MKGAIYLLLALSLVSCGYNNRKSAGPADTGPSDTLSTPARVELNNEIEISYNAFTTLIKTQFRDQLSNIRAGQTYQTVVYSQSEIEDVDTAANIKNLVCDTKTTTVSTVTSVDEKFIEILNTKTEITTTEQCKALYQSFDLEKKQVITRYKKDFLIPNFDSSNAQ